jgi:spermidine synthase
MTQCGPSVRRVFDWLAHCRSLSGFDPARKRTATRTLSLSTCTRSAIVLGLLLAPAARAERQVHVERSAFQTIVVVDDERRRCLRFGDSGPALNQSCQSFAAPERLEFGYARAMVAVTLLWRPEPRHILVIGIGGGSIPTTLARLLPAARIDAVDIDPAVIDVARRFFGFAPDARLRAFARDGRDFVRQALAQGRRYDAVLLDAFDAEGIPPALFDHAFLSDIRRLLAPTGALLANTFAGSPSYASESATAEAVFGRFLNIKLGSDADGNRLLVASRAALPAPASLLRVPPQRHADFVRIGVDDVWLRSWRFAGRDW